MADNSIQARLSQANMKSLLTGLSTAKQAGKSWSMFASAMGGLLVPDDCFEITSSVVTCGEFTSERVYTIEYYSNSQQSEMDEWFVERGLTPTLSGLGFEVQTSDKDLVLLAKLTWGGAQ